jgi:hypothetical protein
MLGNIEAWLIFRKPISGSSALSGLILGGRGYPICRDPRTVKQMTAKIGSKNPAGFLETDFSNDFLLKSNVANVLR